jgi:DNA-binding NtrC family response regulator
MNKHHVILVDDDEDSRFFVEHTLSRAFLSFNVTSFPDGKPALDYFVKAGADVVVTDYKMPGMNGSQLTRALRERGATVPILMISNDPCAAADGMAAGVSGFLEKSELFQLPEVIRNCLALTPNDVAT